MTSSVARGCEANPSSRWDSSQKDIVALGDACDPSSLMFTTEDRTPAMHSKCLWPLFVTPLPYAAIPWLIVRHEREVAAMAGVAETPAPDA